MDNEMIKEQDDDLEIDLGALFSALWREKFLLIFAGLVCAAIAFAGTMFLIASRYQSTFTAFVNNKTNATTTDIINSGDTSAAQQLTKTYASIISSRSVIEAASEDIGLSKEDRSAIGLEVSTSTETGTQLFNMTISSEDAEKSYQFANAVAKYAPDYLADIVEGSSMKIVTKPVLATSPYSPSKKKNTAIGFILGFMLVAAIIVIREILDTRIKAAQELTDKFDLPVLGSIPNLDGNGKKKGGYYYSSYYAKKDDAEGGKN